MRRNKIPRITCEAVQAEPSQLGQLGNVQREILSNVSLQVIVSCAPNCGL